MPDWQLFFSSTSDPGLKGLLAGQGLCKSYAGVHIQRCTSLSRKFYAVFSPAAGFSDIVTPVRTRERRVAQGTVILISFPPAPVLLRPFVSMCKCPRICFFHFAGERDLSAFQGTLQAGDILVAIGAAENLSRFVRET
jgi:hypothetical protein